MRPLSALLAVVVTSVLAACSASTGAAAEPQDIPFVPGQGSAEKLSDVERNIARLAIDALAADLQIPKDGILVDTIRAVNWPDSSIGCPQPGRAYLSVVTPGYKVTLRVDRQVHVVHEAGNRATVCRQTKAMGGITPQRELSFGPQMLVARKDLAGRLGVTEREILFQSGEGKTWNDGALGCPEPGMQYTQAEVRGWVLTFRYRQRLYTYHTDLNRAIPCPPISAE